MSFLFVRLPAHPPFGMSIISLLCFLGISNRWGLDTQAPPTSSRMESLCGGLSAYDPWAGGYQNQMMPTGPGNGKFTAHISLKIEQIIKAKDQK